jgi:hypothetical protein
MSRKAQQRTEILDQLDQIDELHFDLSGVCLDTETVLYGLQTLIEDLLYDAIQIEDLARESIQDIHQRSIGNKRVACYHCDGEFYTRQTAVDPYYCSSCRVAGYGTPQLPIRCDICGDNRYATEPCYTCDYWHDRLAEPDGLVINGNLYFAGPEPTPPDLYRYPKGYGCYGAGFLIGREDGTQILTHNLGHCGEIPAALRPADNAAFLDKRQTPRWIGYDTDRYWRAGGAR